VFLILVSRAPATVWNVQRSKSGVIVNLESKRSFVSHYSFHIMDPDWGHLTIKMAGHPPFGAQILLNGHEYVACQARKASIAFTKEGNCFTVVSKPADLVQVADTLSETRTVGRLCQVCERWIYSACLCFALDLEGQQRSGFRYDYSVYQVERDGPNAKIKGLQHGMGFILWFKEGYAHCLEGYAHADSTTKLDWQSVSFELDSVLKR
jgi:hypothetical protein